MTTIVEAIYEDGVLKLTGRLRLPEKAHVKMIIESGTAGGEDRERTAWLKLSEAALTRTWDHPEEDVLNELLKR